MAHFEVSNFGNGDYPNPTGTDTFQPGVHVLTVYGELGEMKIG